MSVRDPLVSRLRRRLRDESGVALIVAVATMTIVSVLAVSAVTLAVNTNQGSRQNVAQKQALEASQAGLQVALYRYNMLQPSSGNCVGDTVASPRNGACESSVTTLGNGSTYQYFTTPALSSSGTCAGSTVSNSTDVSNACITAIGTSNGVTTRSEIRVASFAGAPLFQYAGITALTGITVENGQYNINATMATNGPIVATSDTINSKPNYQLDLGPSGSYSASNGTYATPPQTRLSSPIVLSPVNPGTSATNNANNACTSYLNGSSACGITTQNDTQYYDPVVYNAATRSLTTSGNASITLTGGVYNFCSFTSSGGLTVNIATGAKATIYIDSPSDPGSGCPLNSTGLNLNSGTTTFSNPSDDPTALQIYVYSQPTIIFNATNTIYGTLYAPSSSVILNNGQINWDGAIAANAVTLDNGVNFTYEPQVSSLQAGTQGLYYRTAWAQCTASDSPSAPMSGCN
jgi:Tfp pilus assembly protein PilX